EVRGELGLLITELSRHADTNLTRGAASGCVPDVVEAIDSWADVNSKFNNYTPLARAAAGGHANIVEVLIVEGADMFAQDGQGRTALDWARIAKKDQVVQILEKAMENDICYRRRTNQAKLQESELLAVIKGNENHMKDLRVAIDTQSLPEIKSILDRTRHTRKEYLEAFKLLELGQADAQEQGQEQGQEQELRQDEDQGYQQKEPEDDTKASRRSSGCDIVGTGQASPLYHLDVQGKGCVTALNLATTRNHVDIVHRLLKEGADPNIESNVGHTALTWASVCGFELVTAELISQGSVDVTQPTQLEGRTALHYASASGSMGVVVNLLDHIRDKVVKKR
ncbi:unnamed protein product, partial [Choristocarpus tenellus]